MGQRVAGMAVLIEEHPARQLVAVAPRHRKVGLGRVPGGGGRGANDLGPQSPEDRLLLLGHLVRHHDDAPVASRLLALQIDELFM